MITEANISLKTELPGPKSKALLERRQKNIPRGISSTAPIAVEEAHGALLKDVDGNVFIDFAGGIGVLNVGHTAEEVVKAVQEQASKVMHTCFQVAMYEPYIQLAEKLNAITPGNYPKKTMFFNSGAEAVENAVKIARRYTNRPGIISLECAFHGRTLMAMSLTSKVRPYKVGFGPFAPETYKIPSPYCYRCRFGLEHPSCSLACARYLKHFFAVEVEPEKIAALIVEPLQGEGGFIYPPEGYLEELQKILKEYGILLIIDEVQSGFARTGKMFCSQHSNIEPDIITMAKSMAGGMPLSAVTGRAEIMDAAGPGEVGTTYGGNPMSCAAALKAIEIMEKEELPAKAEQIGKIMMEAFKEMQKRYPLIGDVRGKGAMVAFELVKDRASKEPAPEAAKIITQECYQKGLIAISAGIYSNVMRFLTPLVITKEQLDTALKILEEAVATAQEKLE